MAGEFNTKRHGKSAQGIRGQEMNAFSKSILVRSCIRRVFKRNMGGKKGTIGRGGPVGKLDGFRK